MASIHPSEDPQLGWLVPCLAVADLQASLAFYQCLGFTVIGGDPDEDWVIVRSRAVELHLFGHRYLKTDLLNLRGGDHDGIKALIAREELPIIHVEGPSSFTLADPEEEAEES